jgi:hypothetical protein
MDKEQTPSNSEDNSAKLFQHCNTIKAHPEYI